MDRVKVGIIGGGTMGEAFVSGLKASKRYSQSDIYIYDSHIDKLQVIKQKYNIQICSSNQELVEVTDVLIIAVKPYSFKTLFDIINPFLNQSKLIVSIAAGVTIKKIEQYSSSNFKIIRTMPNTASRIKEGITGYTYNQNVTKNDEEVILSILMSIGSVMKLEEAQFDVFTSICASSPAFLYLFIESLASVGVDEGMSKEDAYIAVAKAMQGSAKMILKMDTSPTVLKEKVCTKGGTTIEGIKVLEENNFYDILRKAAIKTAERSKEISESE